MKFKGIFLVSISVLLIILLLFIIYYMYYVSNTETFNIYDHEYSKGIIYLDLDVDNNNEEINFNGKYIEINGENYIINKYAKENSNTSNANNVTNIGNSLNDYTSNFQYILDLNNDGYLEIIHRTYSDSVSPITNIYTIYNYKNNNLIEIGKISIMGNIPNDLQVFKNTLKFKYWPYESPRDFTETYTLKLNV